MKNTIKRTTKLIVFILTVLAIIIFPALGDSNEATVNLGDIPDVTGQISEKIEENSNEAEEPVTSGGGGTRVIEVEVRVDLLGMPEAADGTLGNLGKGIFGPGSSGHGGGDDFVNTESEQSEANDKDKKGAGEQGNETNSNSNDASNTGDSETNPGINDLDSAISEIGSNFSNVPDLIKMEVDVDWSKEDTTKNVKKTIKTANSDIWGGTTGTGGGVGGGVGGGGSFINHAESLMDSAVKFTAEAFYGQGSNEHNLGIGGGVGGGDESSALEKNRYINFYFKNSDEVEIVPNTDNSYAFDVFVGGKNVLKGLNNGTLQSTKYNEKINNMRWYTVDASKLKKQAYENNSFVDLFFMPAFAKNIEGIYTTMNVIETNTTGIDEASDMTESFFQICDHYSFTAQDYGYNCFYDNPVRNSTGTPFSVNGEAIHKFGITENLVSGTADWVDAKYEYIFTPMKDSGAGVYEAVDGVPSFKMTDVDEWLSEEDKKSCVMLQTDFGSKKLCYSTELNNKKNIWGSGDINEEQAEEIKNIIEEMPETIDATSPQDDYVEEVGASTPILQYVNEALAKIVKYLYTPYPQVQSVGDQVFGRVLSVSISLIPLAIILTIAISMRNGASSASGIAETRTFFIELIVSLGLAVSSHYIIQQTTKIGTVIAQKIAGNKSFQISGDLMSASNVLEGILMLIVGILFVFMLVAIIIEVFLSAMAMQAHYVMLCAFSPLMLIMSSYKPFKSLRDQWFKMVLHGMIIAPANAIILSIMNTLA